MEWIPDFVNQNLVCKRKEGLYGLKWAAQTRKEKFKKMLWPQSFKQDDADHCLYNISEAEMDIFVFTLANANNLVVATQREQEHKEISEP